MRALGILEKIPRCGIVVAAGRPYKANFSFLRSSYKIAHREGDPVGDFLFRPDRSRWGWTMPYARRAG